jgi:hypothetical protein
MPSSADRRLDVDGLASEHDDPVLAAFLRAPIDERTESHEERAAVEGAKASHRASGRMVPHVGVVAALHRRRSEG